MNETPRTLRTTIALFGRRNAGKSSLLNALCGQEIAVVSDTPGTTTDPVKKTMELFPLGPVTLIDTPGIDDEGTLGLERVKKTKEILISSDVAVLVRPANQKEEKWDTSLIELFKENNIPYIIVLTKADLLEKEEKTDKKSILVSAVTKAGIEELKTALGKIIPEKKAEKRIVADFIKKGTYTVLVCPIDSSAPKGRLILPQQMSVRDILDSNEKCIVCQPDELKDVLSDLGKKVGLVVCDSQVFSYVSKIVPKETPLTSFSILFARKNGVLDWALKGANTLDTLKDGDIVLISEGCTHHRQCEDIGTKKIPKWILDYTKKDLKFEFTQGGAFPEDVSPFKLIVHCGGCMLTEKEMSLRLQRALEKNVPITNYGVLIAKVNGISDRATEFI